jgi:hypothetical protein
MDPSMSVCLCLLRSPTRKATRITMGHFYLYSYCHPYYYFSIILNFDCCFYFCCSSYSYRYNFYCCYLRSSRPQENRDCSRGASPLTTLGHFRGSHPMWTPPDNIPTPSPNWDCLFNSRL